MQSPGLQVEQAGQWRDDSLQLAKSGNGPLAFRPPVRERLVSLGVYVSSLSHTEQRANWGGFSGGKPQLRHTALNAPGSLLCKGKHSTVKALGGKITFRGGAKRATEQVPSGTGRRPLPGRRSAVSAGLLPHDSRASWCIRTTSRREDFTASML